MKRRILFICTGNVCRSPMAAALFTAQAKQMGDAENYEIASAGTWALDGEPASTLARQIMQMQGLDLSGHRGRTITHELLQTADLILVMTRSHQDSIRAEFPATRSKLHLMSELIGQQYDIADPYGRSLSEYEACAAELTQLIERGYPRVRQWLAQAAPREP